MVRSWFVAVTLVVVFSTALYFPIQYDVVLKER